MRKSPLCSEPRPTRSRSATLPSTRSLTTFTCPSRADEDPTLPQSS
jgi:hypothetical protein